MVDRSAAEAAAAAAAAGAVAHMVEFCVKLWLVEIHLAASVAVASGTLVCVCVAWVCCGLKSHGVVVAVSGSGGCGLRGSSCSSQSVKVTWSLKHSWA